MHELTMKWMENYFCNEIDNVPVLHKILLNSTVCKVLNRSSPQLFQPISFVILLNSQETSLPAFFLLPIVRGMLLGHLLLHAKVHVALLGEVQRRTG